MRLIRACILLLVLAVAGFAAPALVQQVAGTTSNGLTGLTLNFGSPIGTNHLVICLVTDDNTSGTSPQDFLLNPSGTSLSERATPGGTGVDGFIVDNVFSESLSTGDTSVFIDTDLAVQLSANCSEWNGNILAVAPLYTSKNGISNTVTTNSITPSSPSNLIIAVGGWIANDYSSGPINSFTRMTPTGGGTVYQEGAYLIQSTATTKSTGWSLTTGIGWVSGIATYKGTTGPTNAQSGSGFFMPNEEDFDLFNILQK